MGIKNVLESQLGNMKIKKSKEYNEYRSEMGAQLTSQMIAQGGIQRTRGLFVNNLMKWMKNQYGIGPEDFIKVVNVEKADTEAHNMIKYYMDLLNTEGIVQTRRELKDSNNIIKVKYEDDITNETEEGKAMIEDLNNYVNSSWLHMIPCLESALIIDGKNYLHYSIKELDLDNQTYTIHSRRYIFTPNNTTTKFMLASQVYFKVKFTEDAEGVDIERDPTFILSTSEIYTMMIDKTNWDFYEKEFWRNVIVPTYLSNKDKLLYAIKLIDKYVGYFGYINYLLDKEPVRAKRGKNSSNNKSKIVKEEYDFENRSEKQRIKIRRSNSQGLEIVSDKKPVSSTEESVRKYKVAVWRVRGHVSHSKSGKEFWVPEHVAHRHNMNTSNLEVPNTIIE